MKKMIEKRSSIIRLTLKLKNLFPSRTFITALNLYVNSF